MSARQFYSDDLVSLFVIACKVLIEICVYIKVYFITKGAAPTFFEIGIPELANQISVHILFLDAAFNFCWIGMLRHLQNNPRNVVRPPVSILEDKEWGVFIQDFGSPF